MSSKIGVLAEKSLHSQLKDFYLTDGGFLEKKVDGFIVDVVQDGCLVEIQTGSFCNIRKKINFLLKKHPVRLVYPLAVKKYLKVYDNHHKFLYQRKSPKKGKMIDAIRELVYIPHLVVQDNFSFEILFVAEEEIRIRDGKGSWRRGGVSLGDRRLKDISQRHLFNEPKDYLSFLPSDLSFPFTNRDLISQYGVSSRHSYRVTNFLCKIGQLERVGKSGRSFIFNKVN